MSADPVLVATDARGVATVTLNRPGRGNAYDEVLLHALIDGSRYSNVTTRCGWW